ncbi:MAG: hypothetical protein LQ339_001059 [Xanthoria mediterranea]|nr:MAG: hypothetical protein LQ339_001059 [Xanthoria mediterranea]
MHCSKVAAVAVALAAPLVKAQAISLWNIPSCAQSAATSGLASTGCDLTDIACVCSAVSFVTKLSSAVQQSCSIADQQATLTFAQGLCSKFGVTLNLPAIPAAAKAASSSAAAPAQAAASSAASPSSAASGTPDQDSQDDGLPATTPLAAAAASSAEPIPTPPVSPDTLQTPASPNENGNDSPDADNDDVATTTTSNGEARLSNPVPTSSALVFDTESIIPSATIASYPPPSMMTPAADADANPRDAQVPAASSTTAYRNSSATANSTVAASSPIPYVGAAIRDKVQGGMVLMVAAGVFWGL